MTSPAEPPTLLNITDIVSGPIAPRVNNPTWPNALHMRIQDIVAQKGPPPWSARLIQDERNLVTLIANPPGSGNRPHWHKDFDEWWVIMAGRLRWELTGCTVIEAGKDESVWANAGTRGGGNTVCWLPCLLRKWLCFARLNVGSGGVAASRKPVIAFG